MGSGEVFKFTVYGNPVPKARARTVRTRDGKSVTYTPPETVAWENSIKTQSLPYKPSQPLDVPLILKATFYLRRPKSRPKKYPDPDRKPDLDNLVKSVKDALEGSFYTNDSRIVEETLRKKYGPPLGVEIEIYEKAGDGEDDAHRG